MKFSPSSRFNATFALPATLVLSACGGGGGDEGSQEAMEPDTSVSAERGKTVFLRCKACHMVEQGKSSGAGPNLHGLFGAKAGVKEGFAFSEAMRNSGITWDAQTLDTFIEKPNQTVKGTRMSFAGISNKAERESLILYLEESTK